jgi:NAD(P)-dependent dehydrogenase (short-subunit alcohol dehydrogenase family)
MGSVVVSGGGSGLGRAAALRLAADGHDVIVVGRRLDALEQTCAAGPTGAIVPVPADLSTVAGAEAVAAHVAGVGRPLDGVVAAAGGRGPYGSPDDSLAEIARIWQLAFDLNVMTAVMLVEALVPALRRPGAAIVLFSSLGVWRPSGMGTYAGAKGALHGYTAALAKRLGPDGITANTIAPGFVPDTEFFGEAGVDPSFRESLVAETVIGRAGTPEEISSLVSWLMNGNGFTTGQVISANGGAGLLR